MSDKPNFIKILIILWIVIGIIFSFSCIYRFTSHQDHIDSQESWYFGTEGEQYDLFYFVADMTIYISFTFLSFLLAFLFHIKQKNVWMIGVIFASFLLIYNLYQPIYLMGEALFNGRLYWWHLIITRAILFVLSLSILYILTRKEIKNRFLKET